MLSARQEACPLRKRALAVLVALLGSLSLAAPPVQAMPSFAVASIDPVAFATSPGTGSSCMQPALSVLLPAATGAGTISYTITPALPAGITLSGRTLTPAPATLQTQAATAYTRTRVWPCHRALFAPHNLCHRLSGEPRPQLLPERGRAAVGLGV